MKASHYLIGGWIYKGSLAVALTLAGLISQLQSPWVDEGPPKSIKTLPSSVESSKTLPIKTSSSSPLWSTWAQSRQEIEQALTWNEIRRFPSKAYKDFIGQLAQEEFEDGHPFHLDEQRSMWVKILSRGIKDYSRKVYRSPYFKNASGYDLIQYELLLEDGKKAYILAYKEKTESLQVQVDRQDLRPIRIDYYVESDNSTWQLQRYYPTGDLFEKRLLNEDEFFDSKEAIVSLSIPLLTAGR